VATILDIVLSLVVRGVIAIAVLNVTVALQAKLNEKTSQAIQLNLVSTVSRIMRYDLEKVGYNWSVSPCFSIASKDTIEFSYNSALAPASSSSSLTQWRVRYFLGDTLQLSNTPNPNDRVLYKSVNGGTNTKVANGVVKLAFQYFDSTGTATANLSAIKSFSVDLIMASGEPIRGFSPRQFYPSSEWYYRFLVYCYVRTTRSRIVT
jgi:hypothetical protein